MICATTQMRIGAAIGMLVLATTIVFGQPLSQDLEQVVDSVSALPITKPLVNLSPSDRQSYAAAQTISGQQLESLVNSDGPKARGLAISLASNRGDLAHLIGWSFLINDARGTIPVATPVSMEYGAEPTTVSEHLATQYRLWFGVSFATSLEYETFAGQVGNPERLVRPWMVRMMQIPVDEATEDALIVIKQEVAILPDEVKWAIVVDGEKKGFYSTSEAAAVLSSLPAELQAAIQNREDTITSDPTLSGENKERADRLMDRFDEIMSGGSQP